MQGHSEDRLFEGICLGARSKSKYIHRAVDVMLRRVVSWLWTAAGAAKVTLANLKGERWSDRMGCKVGVEGGSLDGMKRRCDQGMGGAIGKGCNLSKDSFRTPLTMQVRVGEEKFLQSVFLDHFIGPQLNFLHMF